MQNRLTMKISATPYCLLMAIPICLASCGKKSGPDQTIVMPSAEYTITDHEPGTLNLSKWSIESKSGTTFLVGSYVRKNAPVEVIENIDSVRKFLISSAQSFSMFSRYWKNGEFSVNRQFSPKSNTDLETGMVNAIAETQERAFTFTVTDPNLKQEELTKVADKFIDDFTKANPK